MFPIIYLNSIQYERKNIEKQITQNLEKKESKRKNGERNTILQQQKNTQRELQDEKENEIKNWKLKLEINRNVCWFALKID